MIASQKANVYMLLNRDRWSDITARSTVDLSEATPLDDKKFYEFLWNVINPNQMEEYLAMFNAKQEKTDGSDDQD